MVTAQSNAVDRLENILKSYVDEKLLVEHYAKQNRQDEEKIHGRQRV